MVDGLKVREEFGDGNDHRTDHRVITYKINLKPATILDNRESYNYNKANLYVKIIFMKGANWKDELCG